MKHVFIGLLIISLLTACGRSTGNSTPLTETEENSLFTLKTTISELPAPGEKLKIHSTLTYKGEEDISLMHGEPIVRIKVIDKSNDSVVEPMMYIAVMTESKVKPDTTFTQERSVEIPSAGTYEVEVTTTALFQEDKPLGTITINPIELEIN